MLKLLKFGGSSVADAVAMKRVAGHIMRVLAGGDKAVVVVSALAQVTNQLTTLSWHSREQQEVNDELWQKLKQRHQLLAQQLFDDENSKGQISIASISNWLDKLFNELKQELSALTKIDYSKKEEGERCFAAGMAQILAHGELASSVLLNFLLSAKGARSLWMDARKLIVTDDHWLQAKPDFSAVKERVQTFLKPQLANYDLVVVPGFMGGTAGGRTTLLGREGSDYSAAILAEALPADELEIWSDVDGVMGADPRCVDTPAILPQLSYDQAGELATWGGKILYPATVEPARRAAIPIGIFNSFVASSEMVEAGTYINGSENQQIWAVGGLTRPLVMHWHGDGASARLFMMQLPNYNLELRGLFPLADGFLIIVQDHHRPSGAKGADYAWLLQYASLEFSLDWDLVAVISQDFQKAEQSLTTIEGAWLLPATGLAHSRVALVPAGRLERTLAILYG